MNDIKLKRTFLINEFSTIAVLVHPNLISLSSRSLSIQTDSTQMSAIIEKNRGGGKRDFSSWEVWGGGGG